MKKEITKQDFQKLNIDNQFMGLEELMTDKHFEGQTKIVNASKEKSEGEYLPTITEKQKTEFRNFLDSLGEELFSKNNSITFDLSDGKSIN